LLRAELLSDSSLRRKWRDGRDKPGQDVYELSGVAKKPANTKKVFTDRRRATTGSNRTVSRFCADQQYLFP